MYERKLQSECGAPVQAGALELAVIVPTANSAAQILPLIQALSFALAGVHWEAIFVDDDSSDGTPELIREIGETDVHVRVIHRVGRKGWQSAIVEGMMASSAPVLAAIACALPQDETMLPRLFESVRTGWAEIAIGQMGRSGELFAIDRDRMVQAVRQLPAKPDTLIDLLVDSLSKTARVTTIAMRAPDMPTALDLRAA